jgi:glycosyltransferase involved in cell wall biosynthesis
MTQNIEKRYPEVKTSVISNASDISLFKNEDGSSFDSFNKIGLFIYAGPLGAMDDVDTVVEAAKILKDRRANDIIIEIIGDGADREMLEDKSKIYELDNVRFSGLLPKTEVVKRLKQATATFVCFKPLEVLNTVSPNKMFDSFAAGIPIIQNTTGWIKEYVSDKKCGINVPPGDPGKMADAIMKLHNEKEFRNKLAENAFKSAVDDFDRDKLADKYLRIIDSVIK